MLLFIENLFFYTDCKYCKSIDEIYLEQNLFCKNCINSVSKERVNFCKSCGRKSSLNLCKDCQKELIFKDFEIFSTYSGVLKEIIKEYKFESRKKLSKVLGHIISSNIQNFIQKNSIDVVLYVPSSKSVDKKRGFSHLKEILLNTSIKPEIIKDYLVKIKDTPMQVELSAEERRKNLTGSFIVKNIDYLKDKNVLVFDDVITTGSTLKEVAKTLKSVNIESIFAYVIST